MADNRFRRLGGYAGRVTIEQAAEGIKAAIQNARDLADDAELLLQHRRWPRAASLAILAIEEAGKVSLLRTLLLVDSESEIKQVWRDYRSHTKKNFMGAFLDHVSTSPHIEDFRGLFDPNSDHPQVLDALKQIGFYSDCLGDCHWSVPVDVIDEPTAKRLCVTARLAAPVHDTAMTTAEELELWVKYVKPVWGQNMLQMKQAFLQCFAEASDKGVLRGNHEMSDVARFLIGQFS